MSAPVPSVAEPLRSARALCEALKHFARLADEDVPVIAPLPAREVLTIMCSGVNILGTYLTDMHAALAGEPNTNAEGGPR